jgi:hypothetical protein
MFPSYLRARGHRSRRSGGATGAFIRLVALALLGALMLVLVAPGCGRSSLEPETLDSGTSATACGPSNCPTGCCDATGACRTGRDVRACGSVGGRCSDCVANGFAVCNASSVCGRDDAACSSSTCAGCCALDEGRLRCLSGIEPAACGAKGVACNNCATDGRACNPTTRACGTTSCNASNCDGCCVGNKCLPGDIAAACGTNGAACGSCATGQVCRSAAGGGGRCEGSGTCGPQNCGGCCNAAGQCVTGTDTGACGKQGERCTSCGTTQECVADGQPNARTCQQRTCGPSNCTGCCVGNQCVDNTTPTACGRNGEACKTCVTTEICSTAGTCVDGGDCNPGNCATGCCVGAICAVGTQNTACGTDGDQCQNCAGQGLICDARICQPQTCGPATCPNGCCSQNVCVVGTQDESCGRIGGGACTNCTNHNQVCQGRECRDKCGPANCTGCCLTNNTCATGTANEACGVDGASCANCGASSSFCNGLVTPRRCNNQQTTCPAAYGSCADGVTMPVRPELQGHCSDAVLTQLATDCENGPDAASCISRVAGLTAQCRTCLAPFNHPFIQNTGLYACAASQVSAPCRHVLGCANECAQTSCTQCSAASEDQCHILVNGQGGQCRNFEQQANCANSALNSGLCSTFSYGNYGQWLRGVGDHFCGNGP